MRNSKTLNKIHAKTDVPECAAWDTTCRFLCVMPHILATMLFGLTWSIER